MIAAGRMGRYEIVVGRRIRKRPRKGYNSDLSARQRRHFVIQNYTVIFSSYGLDYRYSRALFEFLKKKCIGEKKLVLVSSHDLGMLEDYCNKILFLNQGQQFYFGSMHDFLSDHQLTREIEISFSGEISDTLKKELIGQGAKIKNQTVAIIESSVDLNRIIGDLLAEVSITSINSERLGLKDIMMQDEGTENA